MSTCLAILDPVADWDPEPGIEQSRAIVTAWARFHAGWWDDQPAIGVEPARLKPIAEAVGEAIDRVRQRRHSC